MARARKLGKPDLFITMTCNPNWPEIVHFLRPGQTSNERPDLIARVFKLKLDALMEDLTVNQVLGRSIGHLHVIEFQKRGLPHAHILLWLAEDDKLTTPEDIDSVVTAELPDPGASPTHKTLYDLVRKHMMHGPCGDVNPKCPCMKDSADKKSKVCSKLFPKSFQEETVHEVNGYPLYRYVWRLPNLFASISDLLCTPGKYSNNRRRNNGLTASVGKHKLDNRWVVAYNPALLLRYNCHMNVEVCTSIRSIKYLHKYVYKGRSRVLAYSGLHRCQCSRFNSTPVFAPLSFSLDQAMTVPWAR